MRKFGIELEVSGVSKEQAAEALQAAGIETVAENYNHRTRTYWKATTDSSIRSDNGLACEIVSPPLPYREASFLTIAKVVAVLKSIGADVNETCGMHVHVDCRNITDPDFYRLLLTFYSKFEGEIDSFVHSTRRDNNNNYCRTNKSLYDNWDRLWSSYVDMAPSCLTDVFSSVERYHKLNFASYVRHGTVEFRQYHGTLDAKSIRAWVDFCVRLVDSTYDIVTSNDKRNLRPASNVVPRNAPQIGDYINKLAERIATDNGQEAREFSDPYQALAEVHRFYRSAVRRPQQFANLELEFSNEQINTIFKFILFLAHHIATRAYDHNIAAVNGNNDPSLRDIGFVFDDEFINYVTALFFGYHGTKEEVTRKVNAKLTNIGALRNGILTPENEFYTCFEWIIDRNSVNSAILLRNKYHKLIFGRPDCNVFHNDRMSEISRFCTSFITRTRRFFVNNPRNLRDVISGNFVRNVSIPSEVVYLAFATSCKIKMWNDESEITYTNLIPQRMTVQDASNFRNLLNSNRVFCNLFHSLGPDDIYSSLNSSTNYDAVVKQPYFELVDRIRTDNAISAAFSGLSDTSKINAVRGDHASIEEAQVADSVRRVREFIESRNAPRPAPRPRVNAAPSPELRVPQIQNPRVVADIPIELNDLIGRIRDLGLPSGEESELIATLSDAARPIDTTQLRTAITALQDRVARQQEEFARATTEI